MKKQSGNLSRYLAIITVVAFALLWSPGRYMEVPSSDLSSLYSKTGTQLSGLPRDSRKSVQGSGRHAVQFRAIRYSQNHFASGLNATTQSGDLHSSPDPGLQVFPQHSCLWLRVQYSRILSRAPPLS